jgi:hypothetical protein
LYIEEELKKEKKVAVETKKEGDKADEKKTDAPATSDKTDDKKADDAKPSTAASAAATDEKAPAATTTTTATAASDDKKKDDEKKVDSSAAAAPATDAASSSTTATPAAAAPVTATEVKKDGDASAAVVAAAKKADDDKSAPPAVTAATAASSATATATSTTEAKKEGDDDKKDKDATKTTGDAAKVEAPKVEGDKKDADTKKDGDKDAKKEDAKKEDAKKEEGKKEETKKIDLFAGTKTKIEKLPSTSSSGLEKVSSKTKPKKASPASSDGSETKNNAQYPPNEDEGKETELDASVLSQTTGPRHVSLGIQRFKDVNSSSMTMPYFRSLLVHDPSDLKDRSERLERERSLFSRHPPTSTTTTTTATPAPVTAPVPSTSSLPTTGPSPTPKLASALREIFERHAEGKDARLPQSSFTEMFGYGDTGLAEELLGITLADPTKYPLVDGGYTLDTLTSLVVSHILLNPESINTIMEWLEACGYDRSIELNHYTDADEAMESQERETWTVQTDHQLMALLQQLGDRCGENNLVKLGATQLRPKEDDLRSYATLEGISLPSLRLRFTFLKKFNLLFAAALPLIDLKRTDDNESIAGLVRSSRIFVFTGVKVDFFQKMLDLTAEPCKPPQVTLNRVKLQSMVDTGESVDFMRDTLFGRTFHQLRSMDPFKLRPVRPQGAEPFMAFEVVIKGEHVVGEGGPYRQFFTDVGHELQNPVYNCPLFTPSPNQVGKAGENRDKFMIRPSSSSTSMIQMYEFLGLLFGCCIRTGVRFPLDLPPFVWKPLVNDSLTRYDLEQVDKHAADTLKYIESVDEKDFDTAIVETFTARLSDKSTVELKDNGANIKVTYENRKEYIHLVLAARLSEHRQQIDAIRRGIALSLPLQLLNLLTWMVLLPFSSQLYSVVLTSCSFL